MLTWNLLSFNILRVKGSASENGLMSNWEAAIYIWYKNIASCVSHVKSTEWIGHLSEHVSHLHVNTNTFHFSNFVTIGLSRIAVQRFCQIHCIDWRVQRQTFVHWIAQANLTTVYLLFTSLPIFITSYGVSNEFKRSHCATECTAKCNLILSQYR